MGAVFVVPTVVQFLPVASGLFRVRCFAFSTMADVWPADRWGRRRRDGRPEDEETGSAVGASVERILERPQGIEVGVTYPDA